MLKFKFDVADALERVGFGVYDAKKTRYISQDTLKKLRAENTKVTLAAINRLCVILDMDLKDVLAWEMGGDEAEERKKIMEDIQRRKRLRRASGDISEG